jgi:hypothetical protein
MCPEQAKTWDLKPMEWACLLLSKCTRLPPLVLHTFSPVLAPLAVGICAVVGHRPLGPDSLAIAGSSVRFSARNARSGDWWRRGLGPRTRPRNSDPRAKGPGSADATMNFLSDSPVTFLFWFLLRSASFPIFFMSSARFMIEGTASNVHWELIRNRSAGRRILNCRFD